MAKWSSKRHHKCIPIPGLEDILVILRTGATESLTKLPVHFRTTLKCMPHYVVYSDIEESVDGHSVVDALDTVNNSDFELYNRLKKDDRASYDLQELQQWSSVQNSGAGMINNPAWKLDKWKLLPLIEKALQYRPDANWYFFMEADTAILWLNLAEWLAKFDKTQPYYLGNQQQIGDVVFGHGGSGFAISKPAMQAAAEKFRNNRDEYEEFTANHWAGDCVLGKLLKDAGISLTWTWPNLQNAPISSVKYTANGYSKRLWCHRAVSYHHMAPEEIEPVWQFEQQLLGRNESCSLKYKDVFERFVLPYLQPSKDDWDNLSAEHVDLQAGVDLFEACKDECMRREECLQFSVKEKSCHVSSDVKLGRPFQEPAGTILQSGWILDRIDAFVRDMEACGGDQEWAL
ncbi:hypothetical protein E4T38_09879 [Aureobasidium subglaciale]|nr:hypothetical protein E4T38_09879 [Aureobasidium subglaciale]KAI5213260.1 hypothetical protein E4T40_09889 [Aureobasidium subglaciale]KAI5214565.1 hypothetical protein E4T41_09885 [Aureobasidium subglaciale]KAI5252673.1 hypothetical protein E4T46_09879 [Aureobasidium subglaciale]